MDFPDVDPARTGEVETRPQRAKTQPARRYPKKRMLGVAPSIFFKVNVPKPEKLVFGGPRYLYMLTRDTRGNKRDVTFLSDVKSNERARKTKHIHKESVSGHTNKKHDESRQQLLGRLFKHPPEAQHMLEAQRR